jgi:hypothetical protein
MVFVYNCTNIFFKDMLNTYEHRHGVERFIYFHNIKCLKKRIKDKLRKTTNTHLGSQSQSLEETVLGDIDITIEETPENIVVERESVDVADATDEDAQESVLSNEEVISNATSIVERCRVKSFISRVTDLFIEIDLLGNYTSMSWFMNLNQMQSINLYIIMRENWDYRSEIPSDIKRRISPLGDPFTENQDLYERLETGGFRQTEEIKTWCLSAMEKLILTGENSEYCKLGTFQVLTALTAVSYQARNSMYWLYETLF